MRLLAVDTAEKSCSIALVDDGDLVCESFFSSDVTHSRRLMDMINTLVITRADVSLASIDGFVVSRGPGGFTGLRIGISVVKALAFAMSKPAAGISSLDGLAGQMSMASLPVVAMMDAKRGEVYTAEYRFSGKRVVSKSAETVSRPEEILEKIHGPAVFTGSGACVYREVIENICGEEARFVPGYLNSIRAATLAQVVFDSPELLSPGLESLLPVYLRRSDAEINYERHPDRFC